MLRIALLQILPCGSMSDNMLKGAEYLRTAKQQGADIALFPEMWSCGYSIPDDENELSKLAVARDGEFVRYFSTLARELDMAIGITFLESHVPLPRNSFCLFDRFGRDVLHYSKVHTCDFGDERLLCPGDDFYVCDLDTKNGSLKAGAMICYDREFPESARILMLKGAELILVPNACPMEINRLAQLRGRAYENMLGIATCNYPAGKPDCNGHSTVYDGIAYLPELSGSRDTLLLEAGESEGVYTVDFPIELLREYRKREVHGNAYRRADKYGLLVSPEVSEPFIRPDKRGI